MNPTRIGLLVVSMALGMFATAEADLLIVDDLAGQFVDIADTGAAINLSGDGEAMLDAAMINNNAVFSGDYIVLGNNGGLGFGNPTVTDLDPINAQIPDAQAFSGGQALLGFWDDIGNTVFPILWERQADRLIVQWENKPFEDDAEDDRITFQIQIFDDVAVRGTPIYAQIIYTDVEQPRAGGGVSATIGYQDGGAGFNDVQWSFNTAGAVSNGTVLSLIPEPAPAALLACAAIAAFRRGIRQANIGA